MQTLPRRLGIAVVVAVIVGFLSIKLDTFRDYQIAEVAVEVTAVAGLTVLTGLSGQISLGQGAFMAIGGYTTALLMLHLNWPFFIALVAAAAVTAATGAIVGVAAARLRGPYLAGATLMLGVALPTLAAAYAGVFGGDQGLNVTFTAPAFLGATFPLTRWQAWVSSLVALVSLVLLANLCYSRIGRNWRAVRDDEVAAALDGVNVALTRVLAFVVSRHLCRAGRLAAGHRDQPGRAGRLHDHAVHRAAHRGRDRRSRQPAGRAVGKPRDRPRAHVCHRRGHQPRPVQFRRIQHPDSRLRRGPHPRHARLPAGDPGRPAPAPRSVHRA